MTRFSVAVTVAAVLLPLIASAQPPTPTSPGGGAGAAATQQNGSTTPPRDPRLVPTGDAKIRGRVVAADTGRPLRRVMVRISGGALRGSRTAATDVDGRYELTELPAGSYIVMASRAGYVSMGYRQPRPNSSPRPIVIADHQVVDAQDIALPPGGAIAGRVLDEYGEPMAGAFVTPQRLQYVNGARRAVSTGGASTNDLGEFRLFGLAPADYYVSVTVRAGNPIDDSTDRTGYAPTYYPSTPDLSAAQRISVSTGQTVTNIELMLVPTRVARVSGFLVDASGAPARGGSVSASLREMGFMGPPANGIVRPDGSFAISGLAPGEYVLRGTLPSAGRPGTWENMAMAYVSVTGADVSNVIVQVQQPAMISGRVVGEPAALALVRPGLARFGAVPTMPSPGPVPPPQPVREDYSFQAPSNPGLVVLRPMGVMNGVAVRAVRLNGRDVTKGFEVDLSTPIDGVEVEVAIATAKVVVTVTNPRNEPVVDQDVLVFPENEAEWGTTMPGHATGGRTNDSGEFQGAALLAGRYYVAAIDPPDNGQSSDPAFLETVRASAARVTLADGQSQAVAFKTQR
jgi:hypothetical protein